MIDLLVFLSVTLGLIGAVPYIMSIVSGSTRPERTTWGIWTVLMVIAVVSYEAEGATKSLWFVLGDLVVTAAIFILALWRGEGGTTVLDRWCIAIAALGVVGWWVSDSPLLALGAVMVADAAGLIPTLKKAYIDPAHEDASTFLFSGIAALCGLAVVGQWDLGLLVYPFYLAVANLSVAVIVIAGKTRLQRRVP